MSALTNLVISTTLDHCQVMYLERATAKWWNERRKKGDPPVFCGWYWVRATHEAGPFKTRSSALRDAYFTLVLKQSVPHVFNRRNSRERKAGNRPASQPALR